MEWGKLGEEIGTLIYFVIGIYLTHRNRKNDTVIKVLIAVFFLPGFVWYWIGYGIWKVVKSFVDGLKE